MSEEQKGFPSPTISGGMLRERTLAAVLLLSAVLPVCAAAAPAGVIRNIHATFSGDPQREVTVSWRSDAPLAPPEARVAPVGGGEPVVLAGESVDSADGFNHHVKLADLQPGLRYAYQVALPGGGWGPVCHFKTAPEDLDTPFAFAVIGDVQGKEHPSGVWKQAGEWLADRDDLAFAVLVGDLVDTGGSQPQWDAFFDPSGGLASPALFHAMVVMPLPGNHDYYAVSAENTRTDAGIRLFLDQFRLPANGAFPEWDGRFYSFTYGAARLVMLDSEGAADTRARMHQEQTSWLKGLPWRASPWNLAFLHRPTYPFLNHVPSAESRAVWRPHFFEPHVGVVFSGHNHAHAVSAPLQSARLHGMAGGRGFSGPWHAEVPAGDPSGLPAMLLLEENDLLQYAGCEPAGRAVGTAPQGSFSTRAIEARRAMTPLRTAERGEIWMSFLYGKQGRFYKSGQGGWSLSSAAAPEISLRVDTVPDKEGAGRVGRFRIGLGQELAVSAERIVTDAGGAARREPFFVLARFVFEQERTIGSLKQYRSPQPLPRHEPAAWDAVIELPGHWETAFDTLTLLGDDRACASLLDDLRIGGTLAAVLPPLLGNTAAPPAWVEERFDAVPAVTPDDGVIYYDAGGINSSAAPGDFWYIRRRQEPGMPLVGIVQVQPRRIVVQTVFFGAFGDRQPGDVLHEFERIRPSQ